MRNLYISAVPRSHDGSIPEPGIQTDTHSQISLSNLPTSSLHTYTHASTSPNPRSPCLTPCLTLSTVTSGLPMDDRDRFVVVVVVVEAAPAPASKSRLNDSMLLLSDKVRMTGRTGTSVKYGLEDERGRGSPVSGKSDDWELGVKGGGVSATKRRSEEGVRMGGETKGDGEASEVLILVLAYSWRQHGNLISLVPISHRGAARPIPHTYLSLKRIERQHIHPPQPSHIRPPH